VAAVAAAAAGAGAGAVFFLFLLLMRVAVAVTAAAAGAVFFLFLLLVRVAVAVAAAAAGAGAVFFTLVFFFLPGMTIRDANSGRTVKVEYKERVDKLVKRTCRRRRASKCIQEVHTQLEQTHTWSREDSNGTPCRGIENPRARSRWIRCSMIFKPRSRYRTASSTF
jgi:hypothetical protein